MFGVSVGVVGVAAGLLPTEEEDRMSDDHDVIVAALDRRLTNDQRQRIAELDDETAALVAGFVRDETTRDTFIEGFFEKSSGVRPA